jgi:CHAD domain-containing protein
MGPRRLTKAPAPAAGTGPAVTATAPGTTGGPQAASPQSANQRPMTRQGTWAAAWEQERQRQVAIAALDQRVTNVQFQQSLVAERRRGFPNASLSTRDMALDTIKKAWKKVIRHGRQVSHETTDRELHALRIDCKKLRYLLEFFSSIFPQKSVAPVIKQLKELQENLGDFVDFSVQLHFLHERLTAIPNGKEENLLAASMGGLMATLFQKQEEARRTFHKTFSAFDDKKTSQLFHDLLTSIIT